MSQEPSTEGTAADHARSGADVGEAIRAAEAGSSVQEVHDHPEESTPGAAPVEQVGGDPEMTEGQVVLGQDPGGAGSTAGPAAPSPGAAQSVRGARASDEAAAGEDG